MGDPFSARQLGPRLGEPAVEVVVVGFIVEWHGKGMQHPLSERNIGLGQFVDQVVESLTVGHRVIIAQAHAAWPRGNLLP